jgi:hypothetical protein
MACSADEAPVRSAEWCRGWRKAEGDMNEAESPYWSRYGTRVRRELWTVRLGGGEGEGRPASLVRGEELRRWVELQQVIEQQKDSGEVYRQSSAQRNSVVS